MIQSKNITNDSSSKSCTQNRIEHNTILTTNKLGDLPFLIKRSIVSSYYEKTFYCDPFK